MPATKSRLFLIKGIINKTNDSWKKILKTPKGHLSSLIFLHLLESIGTGNKISVKYPKRSFTIFLKEVLLKRKNLFFKIKLVGVGKIGHSGKHFFIKTQESAFGPSESM